MRVHYAHEAVISFNYIHTQAISPEVTGTYEGAQVKKPVSAYIKAHARALLRTTPAKLLCYGDCQAY